MIAAIITDKYSYSGAVGEAPVLAIWRRKVEMTSDSSTFDFSKWLFTAPKSSSLEQSLETSRL